MTLVTVTSFGYGHPGQDPPEVDITLDARRLFRNPHADPAMRERTGLDGDVFAHVLQTPGVEAVIRRTAQLAAELTDATDGPVTIAVGCVGGRHRSVAIADALAYELDDAGVAVTLTHRDIDKPVIQR